MSRPNFTAYRALFATLDEAIAFEQTCLSIGRQFLPAVTRRILDGDDVSTAALEEHYTWLLDQADGMSATDDVCPGCGEQFRLVDGHACGGAA